MLDLVMKVKPEPWSLDGGTTGQIASGASFNQGAIVSAIILVVGIIGVILGVRMLADAHKGDVKGNTNRVIVAVIAYTMIALPLVLGAAGLLGLFGNGVGSLINTGGR